MVRSERSGFATTGGMAARYRSGYLVSGGAERSPTREALATG